MRRIMLDIVLDTIYEKSGWNTKYMTKQQLEKRMNNADNQIIKINNWEYPHLRRTEDVKRNYLCIIMYCQEQIFALSN